MLEQIKKAVEVLNNSSSGWASRREAADVLGEAARLALVALYKNRTDKDVDVRNAIEKRCKQLEELLGSVVSSSASQERYTLQDLVGFCQKPGVAEVQQVEGGYCVDLQLDSGRHQTVLVESIQGEKRSFIRVVSYCMHAAGDIPALWMLKANGRFAQAAIGILEREDREWIAVMNTFLEGEVTPREMKAAVKEVAFYADWLEQKLSQKDHVS